MWWSQRDADEALIVIVCLLLTAGALIGAAIVGLIWWLS